MAGVHNGTFDPKTVKKIDLDHRAEQRHRYTAFTIRNSDQIVFHRKLKTNKLIKPTYNSIIRETLHSKENR